jgi:hypothetical protein
VASVLISLSFKKNLFSVFFLFLDSPDESSRDEQLNSYNYFSLLMLLNILFLPVDGGLLSVVFGI